MTFKQKVLTIVSEIPKGSVMTYKEVAIKAGSPGAARAVGAIMKQNYLPEVPCHRVVRSDGVIGDYNRGGKNAKIALLKKEGALV
jgi:methylated-DNA-[protein]-cysteine S-methyltransferase